MHALPSISSRLLLFCHYSVQPYTDRLVQTQRHCGPNPTTHTFYHPPRCEGCPISISGVVGAHRVHRNIRSHSLVTYGPTSHKCVQQHPKLPSRIASSCTADILILANARLRHGHSLMHACAVSPPSKLLDFACGLGLNSINRQRRRAWTRLLHLISKISFYFFPTYPLIPKVWGNWTLHGETFTEPSVRVGKLYEA